MELHGASMELKAGNWLGALAMVEMVEMIEISLGRVNQFTNSNQC